MTISLDAKNNLYFVDGSLEKPSINDKAWNRCNNMVIGWLIASLERSIAKSIMYFKTAVEIWADLKERFGNPSSSQLNRLHERLFNTNEEPRMSISDYFTKVKSLWDEMDDLRPVPTCNCHPDINFIKIQQDLRIMTFLMKIDYQYHQVRSNLLMTKELQRVSKVYKMLLQEESHKDLRKSIVPLDTMAFNVDRRRSYGINSHKNQASGGNKKSNYHCEIVR